MARTAPTHSQSAAKRNRVRERWAQRGFSPTDLLNLWKPNGAWEQYRGLAYGERPRQKLDVYRPRHAAKAPILLFFYGGSWQRGSRDLYPSDRLTHGRIGHLRRRPPGVGTRRRTRN